MRVCLNWSRRHFFYAPLKFENFAEFESNVIKATHGNHQLDGGLYNRVKQRFDEQMGDDGVLFFTAHTCRSATEINR